MSLPLSGFLMMALAACGSAGAGGPPGDPEPVTTSGNGTERGGGNPSGWAGNGAPSGSTSGSTTGTDGTTCADACNKIATCGKTDVSQCISDCSGASTECLDCVASTSCASINDCTVVCQSSSGAGGTSSQGAGGASSQGAGGTASAAGGASSSQGAGGAASGTDCDAIANHLVNDCMYPSSSLDSAKTLCAGSSACAACLALDCTSAGSCISSACGG